MTLDRRTFLERAAWSAAGLVAGGSARAAEAGARAAVPPYNAADPEAFWRAVRAEFPLGRERTYFNTGGLGPASRSALAAVAETTEALQRKGEHGHERFAEARRVLARFLGAAVEEIAFVRNATEGNAIIAAGVALAPGDEVIFETHAHPGGSFAWLNQQTLRGIVVKLFEPAPSPAENVRRIAALITTRTRVVQVSHVTAPTGIVMPVREIAALCRERRIWFHVDGAQSAGMFPFSVQEIGCDSFAASGHKWLGGPLETGVLFVRRERIHEVTPTLAGAYSGELDGLPGEFRLAPTALRFEYGTRNVAAALGLAAAAEFQERIGRERIAARIRELADRVRAGLEKLNEVEILTPPDPRASAAMVTFRTSSVPYDRFFERLVKEHAIRARPVTEQALNAVRVSTHLFNTPDECDALVNAVAGILRRA